MDRERAEERMSSGRPWRSQRRIGLLALALSASAVAATPAPARAADPSRAPLDRTEGGERARVPSDVRRARRAERERLGRFAVLSTDPQSGAVRELARLVGALTGPSSADSADIARAFARRNAATLGVEPADLGTLRLARRDRAPGGRVALTLEQSAGGVPAIDSSVEATLDDRGRLLSVGGEPRDVTGAGTAPAVAATEAYRAARRATGDPREPAAVDQSSSPTRDTGFGRGEQASLVLYADGAQTRLGWRVLTSVASDEVYDTIVDARTGAVQRRSNLVSFAQALVYCSAPGVAANGCPASGSQMTVDVPGLSNANVHAFLDLDDAVFGLRPGAVPAGGEVGPTQGGNWFYALADAISPCPDGSLRCTWDPSTPRSWQFGENAQQSATQLFYFVDRFHDHLRDDAGIGFTAASGNFEGDDPVLAQALDGANATTRAVAGQPECPSTAAAPPGLPDACHRNNASMLVLPDGRSPQMQLDLFLPTPAHPGSRRVSAANDPSVVFHEYAHGLTHRLLTDSQGFDALNAQQASAADEGVADYYALDYMDAGGLVPDGAEPDVRMGDYVDRTSLRTQPIDTPVGAGGHTYAQYGHVAGGPEVHADGEIWAQTMWDLRAAVGVPRTRELVTAALRGAPDEPSFLDLRNAILLANRTDDTPLWQVFSQRGMGYYASSQSSDDTAPLPSFDMPPAEPTPEDPGPKTAIVTGRVVEAGGDPLPGVLVAFAGHEGLGADLETTTNAQGRYTLLAEPRTYPYLVARGTDDGLMAARRADVTLGAGSNPQPDFALRRDHAALAEGAAISDPTGPDPSKASGCGRDALIDQSATTVWGATSPGPQQITVALASPIDLGGIEIDPTAGCGDPAGAALGRYDVEVFDGAVWRTVVSAGRFTPADLHRLNPVELSTRPQGVRAVRLTALETQGASRATDGGFMDVAELAVYEVGAVPVAFRTPADPPQAGGPTAPPAPAPTPPVPQPPALPAPPTQREQAPIPVAPAPPRRRTTRRTPAAVTCATSRSSRRTRLRCRLRAAAGVGTARIRLTRAGRTVARSSGRVRSGRLPTLSLRRAKRRTYRLTVTVTTSSRTHRTVRRTITF